MYWIKIALPTPMPPYSALTIRITINVNLHCSKNLLPLLVHNSAVWVSVASAYFIATICKFYIVFYDSDTKFFEIIFKIVSPRGPPKQSGSLQITMAFLVVSSISMLWFISYFIIFMMKWSFLFCPRLSRNYWVYEFTIITQLTFKYFSHNLILTVLLYMCTVLIFVADQISISYLLFFVCDSEYFDKIKTSTWVTW